MQTTSLLRSSLVHRLLLSSLSLLYCVFSCTSVFAQNAPVVPAPTIITTAPYTITSPGFYQLGADLNYPQTSGAIITVNASNVVLDFAGHYIVGSGDPSSQLVGVQVTEQGNVTIQNGTIGFCYRGINFAGNGQTSSVEYNEQARNMLVSYCFFEAIRLSNCTGSSVRDCRVSYAGAGSTSNRPTVYGVYCSDAGASGNQILNTSVANTTAVTSAYAIFANAAGTQVSNCTVDTVTVGSGTNTYGIYAPAFAVGNTVSSCNIGIYNATKYKDNLTANVTTPFSGGTAVGVNN